jgi:hypothetical protein
VVYNLWGTTWLRGLRWANSAGFGVERVWALAGCEGTPPPRVGDGWRKCNDGQGLGEAAEAINVISLGLRLKSSFCGVCHAGRRASGWFGGSDGSQSASFREICDGLGRVWDRLSGGLSLKRAGRVPAWGSIWVVSAGTARGEYGGSGCARMTAGWEVAAG